MTEQDPFEDKVRAQLEGAVEGITPGADDETTIAGLRSEIDHRKRLRGAAVAAGVAVVGAAVEIIRHTS